MASLLTSVNLLVILSSACCEDTHLAQANVSPIINMKLDPRRKMLTWNYRRNVTWQECKIETPPHSSTRQTPQLKIIVTPTGHVLGWHVLPPTVEEGQARPCPGGGCGAGGEVKDDDTYFCLFQNSVLHRGATLTVNATADGDVFHHALAFPNSGKEGSGAVNFSCVIYNLQFMNCSWSPGPAAPADVQYHLYAWNSMHDDEVECPHYLVGLRGTRVGCHFDKLAKANRTDNYFFLVNGTSKETAIRFLDFTPFKAVQMEKYNPPANITIRYNGSHHIIQWDNPEMRFDISTHILCYELDIQRKGSSSRRDPVFQRGADRNVYLLPGAAAGARSAVRVRGRFVYGGAWSDWSAARPFGLPEQDVQGSTAALVGLVVGAAALLITVLMFLCTRFSLRRKLFPPVPRVNTEVTGTFVPNPEVAWDEDRPPPGSQEPEDVLAVEETRSFASGQGASVGPASRPHSSENVPSERRPLAV